MIFLQVLEWCREFGVTEVTVYAFSLENFKRNEVEVQDLLKLFERKLAQLLDKRSSFSLSFCWLKVVTSLPQRFYCFPKDF